MRVIHVITRLIVGGAQENTVASVLGLRQKPDLQVDLISGPSLGPEGSLEPLFRTWPGVLRLEPYLVRPVHPLKDLLALQRLERIFRNDRPDVVHTHSGKAGILGRIAAAQARVPVIVHTVHGPSFGSFQGLFPNLLFRAAERYVARVTSHFVVVADAMTRQYLAAGIGQGSQYTKILSGFDLEPFLAARNDLALRARLGFQPQALGLEKHFVFTGLVTPQEVAPLIGIMDILIHLSAREGLPRALPQALAAGRPVIAYDSDGANEVCFDNENGFLLRPGDLSDLQERLLCLARDPDLRQRLGESGRAFVRERFSVQQMVDQLYDLYLGLIRKRTAAPAFSEERENSHEGAQSTKRNPAR